MSVIVPMGCRWPSNGDGSHGGGGGVGSLLSRGYLAMSGDILGCHNLGVPEDFATHT